MTEDLLLAKILDSHPMVGASIPEVQKDVGTRYIVERLRAQPESK